MREVASSTSAVTCTTTSGTQNHVRNPCTATTARLRASGARYAVRIAIPVSSDAARTKNAASAAARAAYQRIRSALTSRCGTASTARTAWDIDASCSEPRISAPLTPIRHAAFGENLRTQRGLGDDGDCL